MFLLILAAGCINKDITVKEEMANARGVYMAGLLSDTAFYVPQKGNVEELYDGKPLFRAGIKRGKLNGDWKSWYTNGNICDSGMLINNLPEGVWKYWDRDGNLLAIREYSADKYKRIKGEMLRYNPRRISYQLASMYQQHKASALYHLSASSSFLITNPPLQKLSLLPVFVQKNSKAGEPYTPVFSDCLHHGLYMNFFSTGSAKDSGYYKDGLRAGKWVHYNSPLGDNQQGMYLSGVRVKDWKVYNTAGRLAEVIHYDSKGFVQWRKKIGR